MPPDHRSPHHQTERLGIETISDGDITLTAERDGTRTRIWVNADQHITAGPTFSRNTIRAFAHHILTITETP